MENKILIFKQQLNFEPIPAILSLVQNGTVGWSGVKS